MTGAWLVVWAALLAYLVSANLVQLALLVAGALGNRRREREVRNDELDRVARSGLTIPVSVIIPARDEEGRIVDAVRSVLRSRFPELEVIVVDDGSVDGTLDRLRAAFDLEVVDRFYPRPFRTRTVRAIHRSRTVPGLWVLQKDPGGTADACNAGVNFARYRYVLVTHADCVFHPEALLRTMQPVNFDPGHIVGAGGNLRVLNGLTVRDGRVTGSALPPTLPARFQVLEYATAFQANRLGWSALNAVHLLSGRFSAWRRDLLLELGGFASGAAHEDVDLTVRVHRHFREQGREYRMLSLPDPVVWTEVPATWRGLVRQRMRWQQVLLEVLWRHRDIWGRPRYGAAGTLAIPYLLLFEALGPFIELVALGLTAVLAVLGVLPAPLLLAFLALTFGLLALVRMGSLALEFRYHDRGVARRSGVQALHLCALALLEGVAFRPVILAARALATLRFLRTAPNVPPHGAGVSRDETFPHATRHPAEATTTG
jgi:cellulose synthase/poly-beta-1,6-N-acetylglucosamine synthase-like glycosyltransferase